MTGSDASPGEALPYHTLAKYNNLDKELGKEMVKDVLGNYLDNLDYLDETIAAVQGSIHENPGNTGSEATKAMEVD